MNNALVINFTTLDDVSDNVSFYKNKFIDNGVLVFRNANLSHEDHIKLHDILGGSLGSHREEYSPKGYLEDHSRVSDQFKQEIGNDDVILTWHIEHPHYVNPIVLGSWNMYLFTADENSGKTYFVDTQNLFNNMPDSFKEFAKKCTLINPVGVTQGIFPEHPLVGHHWISNELVLRISHLYETGNDYQELWRFDNKVPTQEEKNTYQVMMRWIQEQISSNMDIRIVHKWKQGDIVVADMYKMCHAVTGGFKSESRKFTGIWGRQR